MYCPECGHKIEDGTMRFCPECGTRLEEAGTPAFSPASGSKGMGETAESAGSKETEPLVHGLIFTNVGLLARKLGSSVDDIAGLFDLFIKYKMQSGVVYRLVDAGNYSFPRTGIFGRSRTASLDGSSPIGDYLEILMDVHNREEKQGGAVSEYLFIIGGADIIPMPKIRHYVKDCSDDTIDTDLVYAYPYDGDMIAAMEEMEAFGYDQMFHVGRLPLGEDTTIEDLAGYLQRDLDSSGVIMINDTYGQCDPNWKKVSANVATDLIDGGCMRNLDGRLDERFYYNRMILSPMITRETVDRVLHPGADLYYFNLHGGGGKETRGYFGACTPQQGGQMYSVILPEHLASLSRPNVVISEACYGGKFIGLDKQRSMMLSAIYTNTLIFVGSSRIAWGAVDSNGEEEIRLLSADVIAYMFIRSALEGYDAGQAMFIARSTLLQHSGWGNRYGAATITEFNLYGDPTLLMSGQGSGSGKVAFKSMDESSIAPKGMKKNGCTMERVDTAGSGGASILQQVRGAVNSNIMEIHGRIAEYLYSNYSVEPRKPDSAFRLKYENGEEEMMFNYKFPSGTDGIEKEYIVSAKADGTIQKVYTTK